MIAGQALSVCGTSMASKSYFKWCKGTRGHLGALISNRKKKCACSCCALRTIRIQAEKGLHGWSTGDKTYPRTKRRSGRNDQKLFPSFLPGKVLLVISRESGAYFDNEPKLSHWSGAKGSIFDTEGLESGPLLMRVNTEPWWRETQVQSIWTAL